MLSYVLVCVRITWCMCSLLDISYDNYFEKEEYAATIVIRLCESRKPAIHYIFFVLGYSKKQKLLCKRLHCLCLGYWPISWIFQRRPYYLFCLSYFSILYFVRNFNVAIEVEVWWLWKRIKIDFTQVGKARDYRFINFYWHYFRCFEVTNLIYGIVSVRID